MTALAAIFNRSGGAIGNADLSLVARALAPHGNATPVNYVDGPLAFVVAPALFTPEGLGDPQPVIGGDGRFALIIDGRIDYRDELASELGISPADTRRQADAWLAMRAFERWGPDLFHRIDGDCAAIVWDRSDQRLFSARDRMGLCPLSYHLSGDRLIVASTPEVLFALGLPRAINRQKLAANLAGVTDAPAESVYAGINRIPAAHGLVVDRNTSRLSRYWSLDATRPFLRLGSDEAYVEAARQLLDDAVKVRLRSCGRIGTDLSGGLDSSTVAVTALGQLGGASLPAFAKVPTNDWRRRAAHARYPDETPYVRQIADMHPRLDLAFVHNGGHEWDSGFDDYFRLAGSVWSIPRYLALYADAFQAARAQGVSVMLNGWSGNLTLSWQGGGAFAEWFKQRRFTTMARELAAISPGLTAFARGLVSRVLVPAGPDWLWHLYARVKHGRAEGDAYGFLNPDWRTQVAHASKTSLRPVVDQRGIRADMLAPDDDHDVAEFHAWVRARHGIDYRDPLRDRRLVEWAIRVPEEQYFRNGQGRWLIKRVMAGRLPEDVLSNPLRGAPEGDWHHQMTRQLPRMREQFETMALDPDVAALLDVPRLRATLNAWPNEPPGDADNPMPLQVVLPHALAVGRFICWTKAGVR